MRTLKSISLIVTLAAIISISAAVTLAANQSSGTSPEGQTVAQADTETSWENTPGELTLSNDKFKKDYYGPVEFSHQVHNLEYGVRCAVCHHFQEGDPNPAFSCAECHHPEKKVGKVVRLLDAYHTDCRGCHQALTELGETDSAPFRKCTDCHEEKSQE